MKCRKKVIGNHLMMVLCVTLCIMLSVFRLWIKADYDSCAACGKQVIRPLHCVRAMLRIYLKGTFILGLNGTASLWGFAKSNYVLRAGIFKNAFLRIVMVPAYGGEYSRNSQVKQLFVSL